MGAHPWKEYFSAKNCLMAAAVLIVLLAGYLRTVAATDTIPDKPYRADAIRYYTTAYNIRAYSVYSHNIPPMVDGHEAAPQPDAFLTPGYPLFLSMFVDTFPNAEAYSKITANQALLATLAVLLVLLLYRPLSPWIALPAASLTAISPHLISAATYILSETLFSVLLILSLLVLSLHARGGRWYLPSLLVGGLLLGAATLTRPVMELFSLAVIFLLWLNHDHRTALRGAAVLLLGFFLAWGPWMARNYLVLGKTGDSGNMVQTLAIGMYPDFEYNHDPNSDGEPSRLDPRFPEISKSLGSALKEIAHQFRENPGEELRWYLVGKPVTLWSWNITAGGGDVFIYPVLRSPYSSAKPFQFTHALMQFLHWPLVILALIGCLLVWSPRARDCLVREPLLLTRLMSLLLLYNTAVLMVLAPFVRYSIPFLPIQYGMALIALYLPVRWFTLRRKKPSGGGQVPVAG